MKHISEIYLMGQRPGATGEMDVKGVLPASIGQLQHLVALSIVNSGLAGDLPPTLGDIPALKMFVLKSIRPCILALLLQPLDKDPHSPEQDLA